MFSSAPPPLKKMMGVVEDREMWQQEFEPQFRRSSDRMTPCGQKYYIFYQFKITTLFRNTFQFFVLDQMVKCWPL